MKEKFFWIFFLVVSNIINLISCRCCNECIFQFKENNWYNVKLFDEPKNSNYTGFCASTFNEYGTCCDQHDVTQYSKNWLKSIKQRVKASVEFLPKFKNSIQNLDKISTYIKKNENAILKSKALTKKELDDFKLEIKNYAEGVHDLSSREEKLKGDLEKCYGKLIDLRAGAVCLRCSGKSSHFYNKILNKLIISKQACRPVIKSCLSIFSYFAEVTTFYRRMSQIRKSAKGSLRPGTRASGLLSKDLSLLRVCGSNLKACTSKEELYVNVCKLIGLAELTPDIEGEVETFMDGFEAVNLITLGKSPGGRRMLASSGGGSGDVKNGKDKKKNKEKKEVEKRPRNLLIGYVLPSNDGADFEKRFNASVEVVTDFGVLTAIKIKGEMSGGRLGLMAVLGIVFWGIFEFDFIRI